MCKAQWRCAKQVKKPVQNAYAKGRGQEAGDRYRHTSFRAPIAKAEMRYAIKRHAECSKGNGLSP